jgi:hypothetical protein
MKHPRLAMAAVALVALGGASIAPIAGAQPPAPSAKPAPGTPPVLRPGLLWKEEWKQNPNGVELAIGPGNVRNPDLEVKVYGPDPALQGKDSVLRLAGKDGDENNPSHLFSGECKTACGFTFRSKKAMADLSGLARIRVNAKMSGLHRVYPIIKLASGDWYIGDQPQGGSAMRDWIWSEFNIAGMNWIKIDPATLLTHGLPVANIDLTKVDEIGFADPMPSSGHGAGGWFDVGQIEVYAKTVAR